MATTSASTSLHLYLSPRPLSFILSPKCHRSVNTHNSSFSITSPLIFQPTLYSKRATHLHIPPPREIPLKSARIRRVSAASGDALPPEANPVESSQEIVSSVGDDGVSQSQIISVLLFIAFIGLSILTIGVIYIAVTDFLQKRERERFEKEAAAEKKKRGKKGQVRARAGPRGFGQKLEEEEEY